MLDGSSTIGDAPGPCPAVHVDTAAIATDATSLACATAAASGTTLSIPIPIPVPIAVVSLLLGVLARKLKGMLAIVIPIPILVSSGATRGTAATLAAANPATAGGTRLVACLEAKDNNYKFIKNIIIYITKLLV